MLGRNNITQAVLSSLLRMREEIFSELVMLGFLIRGDMRSGIIDGVNVRVRISHQDRGMRGDNQLATVIHQFVDTH